MMARLVIEILKIYFLTQVLSLTPKTRSES